MSLWQVFMASFKEWSEDRASRLAAAFAYYAIFSMGPLLLIAITLLGVIYGQKAAGDHLRPQLAQFIGEKGAEFAQDMVAKAGYSPGLSFAGILSIVLILYAATNLFVSLQDALNTIFDVEPKPNRGITGIVKDRALSFVMVLLLGAFILASVVATTMLSAVTDHLHVGNPAVMAFLLQLANFVVSTLIFTGIFSMLFKYLPDIKIDWRDTILGAGVTAALFSLARIGLGYYLSHSSTAGPFGAAGSLVIVMLFVYYSAQILFFGAEFTQVWAKRAGKTIEPSDNAVSLDPEFTKTKEGTGAPESSSGATGSRRHFDSTRQARGESTATSSGGRSDSADSAEQQEGDADGLSYPANKYHPPMRRPASTARRAAGWAALAALPAALLMMRHNHRK
jgi:membrane protein